MTDRAEVLQILDTVRKTGIARNREEATRGICTAAIAVRATDGGPPGHDLLPDPIQ